MLKELFTIGHSTLSSDEYIALLKTYDIRLLVDVRAFPFSKRMTHFNQDVLDRELTKNGISYLHMKELGGRRKFDPDKPDYGWKHRSFAAYAQYMQTPEFHEESNRLALAAQKEKTAIMCAEKLWWKCHRRMIADHFLSQGWTVTHILTETKTETHVLSLQFRSYQTNLFE